MLTKDIITEKLTKAFGPESLRVEDESDHHIGHAGHRPGGETHYRVYIVAEAFRGKSRIERHRLINATLVRANLPAACTRSRSTPPRRAKARRSPKAQSETRAATHKYVDRPQPPLYV